MALEALRKPSHDPTHAAAVERTAGEPTTHSTAAVDPDRLFVTRPFGLQQAGAGAGDPDEAPLSWNSERSAPPNPFELFDCTAKGDPPDRVKLVSKKRVSEPSPPVHHTGHHRPDKPLLSESELPDFSHHRRDKYWNAFKSVSADAQARHGAMGDHHQAFREADGDTGLAALDYRLPTATWKGNLADLTDKQKVPQQDGATVGSLFDGNDTLRLDKHDQHAIDGAGAALNKGKGTIQEKLLKTIQADAALRGRVKDVSAAAGQVTAAAHAVHAAIAAIAAHRAGTEAAGIQTEIDRLKGDANEAKEVVDVVLGIVSGMVYAATGEVGDAINQVGVVAGTLLGHLNDGRIARQMEKLAAVQQKLAAATASGLGHLLAGNLTTMLTAKTQLDAAGDHLDVALTQRREAYNELAFSAGQEIPCPERNRHKIAAMLAAIPLVELVVSRARTLGSSTAPAYNDDAARGLGMATYHGLPVASAFRRACGELNFNRMTARLVEGEWMTRLQALLDVKARIAGPRPGQAG